MPDGGTPIPLGSTGFSLFVPTGWAVNTAAGPPSQLTAWRSHPDLAIGALFAEGAAQETMPGLPASPLVYKDVAIPNVGTVTAVRIAEGSQAGLRYDVGSSQGWQVIAEALGPVGTCDETLLALLNEVTIPSR